MKTKNSHNNNDKLIRDLFREFTPEKAPDNIKQNVMNRVLHEWVEQPQNYQPLINKANRWWIIGAAATILAVTFLVDASVIQQYLESLGLNSDIINLNSINQNLKQSFVFITKVPLMVYFVGCGVLFLLGIDKMLNHLANM